MKVPNFWKSAHPAPTFGLISCVKSKNKHPSGARFVWIIGTYSCWVAQCRLADHLQFTFAASNFVRHEYACLKLLSQLRRPNYTTWNAMDLRAYFCICYTAWIIYLSYAGRRQEENIILVVLSREKEWASGLTAHKIATPWETCLDWLIRFVSHSSMVSKCNILNSPYSEMAILHADYRLYYPSGSMPREESELLVWQLTRSLRIWN